jgi:hypothetical protein
VFCDVGQPVLWLLALSVVVGIWWMPERIGHREKKKKKDAGGILGCRKVTMWPFIASVVAVFVLAGGFCLLRQVPMVSGEAPAMFRRASSYCFVLFFNVLLLFLGTAGLFCVFPASFEAPSKFCIFRCW